MSNQQDFSVKSLFLDTLIYGIARFVNAFLSILLIPVYTRYFTVAEYGIIENLNIFNILIVNFFGLALCEAIFRHYTLSDIAEERKKILSTVHYVSIVSGIVAVLIGIVISGWFGEIFIQKSSNENFLLVILAVIQAFFVINLTVYQSVLRTRFKRLNYNVTTIGTVVVTAVLSIFFVVIMKYGIISVFLASLIANLIFAIYGYWLVKDEISISSFQLSTLKRILPYCSAFIPASLAMLVMRSSDRYFMTLTLDDSLHQVGLYTTAEKVMMPLLIVTAAYLSAFTPFILNAAKVKDIRPLLINTYKLYIAATTVLVIFFAMISKYLLMVLTTPPYYPSFQFTHLVGVYLLLNSAYHTGTIGLILKEKSKYIGVYTIVSSIINVLLNILLIPNYGIEGALYSTIISFFILNILLYYQSQKYFQVDFPHLKSIILLVLCMGISYVALDNLVFGILLLGLFVVFLFYIGYLKKEYVNLQNIRGYFVKGKISL